MASFPSEGLVIKQKLNHQGNEVVTGETKTEEDVAIMGLYQVPGPSSGRFALYGDSNCLDNAHMEKGIGILPPQKGCIIAVHPLNIIGSRNVEGSKLQWNPALRPPFFCPAKRPYIF